MKRILFKEKSAQRIYDDYFKRVEKALAVLSEKDKQDLMMEINSHFYEGMKQATESGEVESLLNITEKLGVPEEVFKPMVAEKKLMQATRTFNPKHIFQAFILNLNKTAIFILLMLFGMFSLALSATIITKIIFPEQTGIFIKNGHLTRVGFSNSVTIEGQELLGYWYIPLVLLMISLLYFLTVLLIRLMRKK